MFAHCKGAAVVAEIANGALLHALVPKLLSVLTFQLGSFYMLNLQRQHC